VVAHMLLLYILIFIISCLLLAFSSKWLVDALTRIARFLGWREFVVTFFTIGLAASIPNLFVGIISALHKIPQLSFGDVISGNVIDLTLVIFLTVFISRSVISTESRLVQNSAIFTAIVAILPLILILDGALSRGDGLVLISAFIFYIFWLFSKKERFTKIYNGQKMLSFKIFFKDLGGVFLTLTLLLLAAEGIVRSAVFFSSLLNLPLILIGILIIALGNALPETYFAIISAKRDQNWMVLGDLMSSIIGCATFVLGIVALICPIQIINLPTIGIARFFLIASAIFFLIFIRTGQKITKKEASFLLLIYLVFILVEIIVR